MNPQQPYPQANPYGNQPGMAPARRPAAIPQGIVAVIGGILVAIGSFLTWATVTVPAAAAGGGCNTLDATGIGKGDACGSELPGTAATAGWITVGAGVVVLIGGVLLASAAGRVFGGVLALIGGAGAIGWGLYKYFDAKSELGDQLAGVGASISMGIGMWMILIGGAVALLAGIAGFIVRKS